jgi:hypothetical protein
VANQSIIAPSSLSNDALSDAPHDADFAAASDADSEAAEAPETADFDSWLRGCGYVGIAFDQCFGQRLLDGASQ